MERQVQAALTQARVCVQTAEPWHSALSPSTPGRLRHGAWEALVSYETPGFPVTLAAAK